MVTNWLFVFYFWDNFVNFAKFAQGFVLKQSCSNNFVSGLTYSNFDRNYFTPFFLSRETSWSSSSLLSVMFACLPPFWIPRAFNKYIYFIYLICTRYLIGVYIACGFVPKFQLLLPPSFCIHRFF